MFTYLNPDVRQRLIADGKLTRIDAEGQSDRRGSARTP